MMKKLLTRLSQHDLFAQPVQKATADIRLQRLDRVAHAGLCEMKFACGLRKASRARQHAERANLPTIEWCIHK